MAETNQGQAKTLVDAGSFRDWDARVFRDGARVLRALSPQALADWHALSESELFRAFTATGELVATEEGGERALDSIRMLDPRGDWTGVLTHQAVPFVSYPYEWSFSMLRDAALLQLRLLSAALAEGLMLKDASPYNVQWRGSQPVFIDIGSFERRRPGEPWTAYRQFCMLSLYPLFLEAYRGVPFQPWLRGRVDGISPSECRALLTFRDALRPGVLRHVFLHAGFERRFADRGSEVREELSAAGLDARLVQANVTQMTKLVSRLRSHADRSAWQDYRSGSSYLERDSAAKEELVRRVVGGRRRRLTWDLGCNDGRFSLIASDGADVTVAIDSDAAVVDALYRSLRDAGNRSILPLVVDLADPSPPVGWRNEERATLLQRGLPDLTLCLALVHHLSIGRNIPLREIVAWLRSLDSELVVEFPHREDPMVQSLLLLKRADAHPDYERETFEALLAEAFGVVESLELSSGTRTLYVARPV